MGQTKRINLYDLLSRRTPLAITIVGIIVASLAVVILVSPAQMPAVNQVKASGEADSVLQYQGSSKANSFSNLYVFCDTETGDRIYLYGYVGAGAAINVIENGCEENTQ